MELKLQLPQIEAAAVRGWPALETAEIDGWLWRYSGGGSTRANSVATLAFTGRDVEATIKAIQDRARLHGVPACIAVSDVSMPPDLDARLASRGYVLGDPNSTMAKLVDTRAVMPAAVTRRAKPSDGWMQTYMSGLTESRRTKAREILHRLPTTAVFLAVESRGEVTTSGMTIGDGPVASVQCVATLPFARRQGGAQMVLAAIQHLAAQDGRHVIYLQTPCDNRAAQSLYSQAGFVEIGRYHTRTQTR